MEQHPIPQHISSYEFRLVGNMTLKQFLKLASGLVLAFLFYSSSLPFLFKWPLVLGFGAFGAALAFLPVNERPLDVWVLSFFKRVFSPTIYLWQKDSSKIDVFEESFKPEEEEEEERPIVSKEPQLKEFLASLPKTKEKPKPELEIKLNQPEKKEEKEIKGTAPKPVPEIKIKRTSPKPTAEAEFGEIPMPKVPTEPNIVVGMITDQKGKIIEDAIIEIQDLEGNPVRALRSNQLGQFRSVAPLAKGDYVLLTEKKNFQFDIIKIKVEDKVIEPIKIKAKK